MKVIVFLEVFILYKYILDGSLFLSYTKPYFFYCSTPMLVRGA